MTKMIETGIINPRDYGIVVQRRYNKFFFSPFKYALAKLMLETPQEISQRLNSFADINSFNQKEVKSEFKKSVKKREKLTRILDLSANEILSVANFAKGYSAEVLSKSQKNKEPYKVFISGPSTVNFSGALDPTLRRCTCDDSHWSDVKRRSTNCIHLSTLELALYLDNKSRKSIENNLTALLPSERPQSIVLPFELATNTDFDYLLTLSLWQYYVEGKTQYEINKSLLKDTSICSESIKSGLFNDKIDSIQFSILRHNKSKKDILNLTESQKRVYGASNALEERIIEKLKSIGFNYDGYGLEFKGTENEVVAKRFRSAYQVISICNSISLPPILVKKYLGAKQYDSTSLNQSSSLVFNQKYESIDDNTRRESLVQVFIPGEKENSDIFVPEILKYKYKQIKQNY